MKAPHLRKGRRRAPSRARYFVPATRGLDSVLVAELQALGLEEIAPGDGGASFNGTLEACYRANLWLDAFGRQRDQ